MANRFLLLPRMVVPEQTLRSLEHLCLVQSEQLWVSADELENRLRDTRKWHRLHLVEDVSDIYTTFLSDSRFALLGKYLTRTLTMTDVPDFLRLFVKYLSPFGFTLPLPLEQSFYQQSSCQIACGEERNLRMFVEAFAAIYGHYSAQTVDICVQRDIEDYLRDRTRFDHGVFFPFLGSITFDFFGRVLHYRPGPTLEGIWPDYSPLRTVSVNL